MGSESNSADVVKAIDDCRQMFDKVNNVKEVVEARVWENFFTILADFESYSILEKFWKTEHDKNELFKIFFKTKFQRSRRPCRTQSTSDLGLLTINEKRTRKKTEMFGDVRRLEFSRIKETFKFKSSERSQ